MTAERLVLVPEQPGSSCHPLPLQDTDTNPSPLPPDPITGRNSVGEMKRRETL